MIFFCLVILFALVPGSSFRELLTDSSVSAGLLRKFNNAITQQKVLENYIKRFTDVESRNLETGSGCVKSSPR